MDLDRLIVCGTFHIGDLEECSRAASMSGLVTADSESMQHSIFTLSRVDRLPVTLCLLCHSFLTMTIIIILTIILARIPATTSRSLQLRLVRHPPGLAILTPERR